MNTKTVPFKIYLPSTENTPAQFVEKIMVKITIDEYGNETLTSESSDLIEQTQARHLGMMTGSDIKALRIHLELTQAQFATYLKCGTKSLSRWENGKGYPSAIINQLLRLLEESRLTLEDLAAVDGPRQRPSELEQLNKLRHQSTRHKEQGYYNYLDLGRSLPTNVMPFDQLAS